MGLFKVQRIYIFAFILQYSTDTMLSRGIIQLSGVCKRYILSFSVKTIFVLIKARERISKYTCRKTNKYANIFFWHNHTENLYHKV